MEGPNQEEEKKLATKKAGTQPCANATPRVRSARRRRTDVAGKQKKRKNLQVLEKIRLWIDLNSENLKGILLKLIPVLMIIILAAKFPMLLRDYYLERYDSEVPGVVDEIKKIQGIQETQEGSKIITRTYKVNYHFVLSDQEYKGEEEIHRGTLSLKERSIFDQMKIGDTIRVKFKGEKPEKSRIMIK